MQQYRLCCTYLHPTVSEQDCVEELTKWIILRDLARSIAQYIYSPDQRLIRTPQFFGYYKDAAAYDPMTTMPSFIHRQVPPSEPYCSQLFDSAPV